MSETKERKQGHTVVKEEKAKQGKSSSPGKRVLKTTWLIAGRLAERSKKCQKLSSFHPTCLLPECGRCSLLHSELVASVEESVRVLWCILDPHLHRNGHSKEDVEARH